MPTRKQFKNKTINPKNGAYFHFCSFVNCIFESGKIDISQCRLQDCTVGKACTGMVAMSMLKDCKTKGAKDVKCVDCTIYNTPKHQEHQQQNQHQ